MLLVSEGGPSLAQDVFDGKNSKGMLCCLSSMGSNKIEKLTGVADSGLLSQSNFKELLAHGHDFISEAKIKIETQWIKEKISSHSLSEGNTIVIEKSGFKLLVSYSHQRAENDKYNRGKRLKHLEKAIKTGRLTKAAITHRGYNKFMEIKGQVQIRIDQ